MLAEATGKKFLKPEKQIEPRMSVNSDTRKCEMKRRKHLAMRTELRVKGIGNSDCLRVTICDKTQ